MRKLEFYKGVLILNKMRYGTYQEHVNKYAFASNFVKDKIILDLACGTGYGCSYLRRKGANGSGRGHIPECS